MERTPPVLVSRASHAMVVFLVLIATLVLPRPLAAGADSAAPSPPSNRLSLCFGGLSYVDDDMELTYGASMAVGIRWASLLTENTDFFIGLHYVGDSGDPYYSVADFSADDAAQLSVSVIEFGARRYTSAHPHRKFYLGMAAQHLWVKESVRGALCPGPVCTPEYCNWGWGVKILAGPEWRFSEGRLALGAEFSFGIRSLFVVNSSSRRIADLTGLGSRAYFSAYF